MLDRLEAVLRTGADQFAETVRAPSAELIRTRGDRRRMRNAAGSAMAAAIVLAVAVAAAQVLTGSGHSGPSTPTSPSLHLTAPDTYLAGIPNPVMFTIPGQHHPATVTVKLDLGKPSYAVDGKGPIVFRRDPVTNRWLVVALTARSGGWTGGYTVLVPAIGLAQHLAIVPARARVEPPRGAGGLEVQVLAGRKVIASQRGPGTSLAEILGTFTDANAGDVSVPRGGNREFTVTVHNPVRFSYRLSFTMFAMLCPGSTCPSRPAGIDVQWLRAGRWRDLSQAAWVIPGNGEVLETKLLAPLATVTFRFRVLVTAPAPSLTGLLELDMDPDRASFPVPSRFYSHYTFTVDSTFIDIG